MQEWIDIHCHIPMLEGKPEEMVAAGKRAGVQRFITIGTQPEDWDQVALAAKTFAEEVFFTWGVHPHEAQLYNDDVETRLRSGLNQSRLVAVGEIGLDYYYNHSPKEQQIDAFCRQLELAAEHQLPVEIHTRDAEADTIDCLRRFRGRVQGVIHCFSGTDWLAKEALDLGYDISFSGILTFKSAESLREICKNTPLDRMHAETDSPYLAPVPKRGQKNQPAYLPFTAQCIADLKGMDLDALAFALRQNALRRFPRLQW